MAIEVRINPSNIQRLINEQVEQFARQRDQQREDYLLRYFGLNPDQLARDGYTLSSWRDDQRMVTAIEIRDTDGDRIDRLLVSDEVLYQADRSFRRLTDGFRQVATAAATLAPALARFGRAAIEAASVAEQERIRYEMREGVWGRDQALGVDSIQAREWVRDGCDCIFCREYRNQRRDPEAQQNARTLLLSCLTPAQQEEYRASQSFTVKVQSGNRYRIESRKNYNVVGLSRNGRHQAEYCAGPVEDVPIEDQMLAQKLLLETDEAGFLAVANGRSVGGREYIDFSGRMGYR
jgi:hypothetical protein